MTNARTVDKDDELLAWLVQSYQDQCLAAPRVPSPDVLPDWADGAGFADFPIDYEPRCIAVSPDGPRVAVGTKAGSIFLARWSQGRWASWEHRPEGPPLHAIRAVAMPDAETLVAGWGPGNFRIFELEEPDPGTCLRVVNVAPEGGSPGDGSNWMWRFSRMLCLQPPASPLVEGNLMLGLSIGPQVHLLSLEKDGQSRYDSRSGSLESLGLLEWTSRWGRMIDGVWALGHLWILSSSREVHCYAPGEAGRPQYIGSFPVEFRKRGGSVRGLSGCDSGLAVLASGYVTFLRFTLDPSGGAPRLESQDVHWYRMPDATDCTVCLPYPLNGPPNPIWTVVSTGKDELRWIAWPDAAKPAAPDRSREDPSLPWQAPPLFTGLGKGIIYARFGWTRTQGRSPFLAIGTRDHRLKILSVLDRDRCRPEIGRLMKGRLPDRDHADRLFQQVPGATLWVIQRRIRSDFGIGVGEPGKLLPGEKGWRASRLLEGLTEDNLRTLVVQVLQGWDKAPKEDEAQRRRASRLVITWMLRLLQKAYQFGPDLARDLARDAQARIGAWRGKTYDGAKLGADLGLFAGFLRKWVLRGYTYEEKPVQLYRLYEWNRDCGRSLDALAYLTRVMRRRVDPQWVTALSERDWSPAVWDVVACPAGGRPLAPFSVASFTDGKLSAFSASGRPVPWRVVDGCQARFESAPLELGPNRLRLRHRWAREFLQQYRHGPYARSLLLTPLSGPQEGDRYLLFFCLRGWRSQDREDRPERKPRLCALWIRPRFTGEEVEELVIEDVAAEPIEEELYGLCELDSPFREAGNRLILAGTNGTTVRPDRRRVSCPFLEVEVRGGDDGLEIEVRRDLDVTLFPKGQRSLFRNTSSAADTAYNPCWVLTTSKAVEPGSPTVWCGFQDGSIRGFKRRPWREEGPPVWVEGGWRVVDGRQVFDNRPRQKGLKVSAAVWSLLRIERPDELYLAYGTGDGTLGLLDLKALEGDEPEEFCHLLHTREASPVCELTEYREDGGQRLLAMTQQGVVCIFSLDFSASPRAKSELSPRFLFPGLRLDHFSLRHPVRAMVRVDSAAPAEDRAAGPWFLVGSIDGSIHLHHLKYPRNGSRRKALFDAKGTSRDNVPKLLEEMLSHGETIGLNEDGTTPGLVAGVGRRHDLAWLRVLDLEDLNLVKVSLWRELNDRAPVVKKDGSLGEARVRRYIRSLRLLAGEVYSRQPFSKEPAKVLWEVTARTANQILERALVLEDPEKKRRLLSFHRDLALAIDDLCNRWIGFEQSFEAKVLIHSFEVFFDWTHIVLLASSHEQEEAAAIRRFLLQKTVRRRLHHSNAIVALEALRVLNAAMIRAVWNLRAGGDKGPRWNLHLRLPDAPSVGFYELMTLVGDLGERWSESLVPANPFSTELIRFFALSILLLPESGLIVGQVVSESRLIERGSGLARAIEKQAQAIAGQLGLADPELGRAIQRFGAYYNTQAELDLICRWPSETRLKEPAAEPPSWRFLLREALRQAGEPTPDARYLAELKNVMIIASWSSWLDDEEREAEMRLQNLDPQSSRRREEDIAETFEELGRPPDRWHYFKHSARYLSELQDVRRAVRQRAGLEDSRSSRPASIREAIDLCDQELSRLEDADLFRPQRNHYEQVIRRWRESLMKRAEKAVRVLDLMDEFNRHVYHMSADNLMTSITELALQAAPISFYEGPHQAHEGPLRLLIHDRLESHPLVREVFERGDRLVDYTHLSGTLLAVARDYLGKTGELDGARIEHHVTRTEVLEEIETARVIKGLVDPRLSPWEWLLISGDPRQIIPGTRAIWSAIAQEFATNISRYCRGGPGAGPPYLKAAIRQEAKESCVLISGSFPFFTSLPAQRQDELRAVGEGDKQVGAVEGLIRMLWEPRVRIHGDDAGSSSGMGLHLIQEISLLCGLEADLVLRDPVAGEPQDEAGKLQCPLCLKLEWKPR